MKTHFYEISAKEAKMAVFKRGIIIVSNGIHTTALIDGQCVPPRTTRLLFEHDVPNNVVLEIAHCQQSEFYRNDEETFWKHAERILGKGLSLGPKKDLELEKNSLVNFHAKLRDYCSDRDLMCDGGDEGEDCPFVEYCFRAAAELSDESVKEAFDALNPV